MSDPIAYQSPPRAKRPGSLIAVAWIFIAVGILSAIDIIWSLYNRRLSLNLGVLFFFIGHGLLRLSPVARLWALIFIWFQLIGIALITILFLIAPGGVYYTVNGQRTQLDSPTAIASAIAICVALLVFFIWQLRTLTHSAVRTLFVRH
jgi:hypothetical protein